MLLYYVILIFQILNYWEHRIGSKESKAKLSRFREHSSYIDTIDVKYSSTLIYVTCDREKA